MGALRYGSCQLLLARLKNGPRGLVGRRRRELTVVASKGPDLSTCRCHLTEAGGNERDYNDHRHNIGRSIAAGSIEEHLDEWYRRFENRSGVTHGENESHAHEEHERSIRPHTPHNRGWYRLGGILDLFGHVDNAVVTLGGSGEQLTR